MIHADYSATTPVDQNVVKKMLPYFSEEYGNPSSLHTIGRAAKKAVDSARMSVSKVLNCDKNEIVFCSGGTESVNLATLGYAKKAARDNKKSEKRATKATRRKKVILCSEIEHHAVLDAVKQTEEYGFNTERIPVTESGLVDINWLKKRLAKGDVALVSVMYANNEIGTIQPIRKLSKMCRDSGAVFHTDACQAPVYLDVNVKKLGVDMMTLNGSKIYGPKGVGALYVRDGIKLSPIVYGGGQEKGLRSGTENVPGIVGFAEALKLADGRREKRVEKTKGLRDRLIKGLSEIDASFLNGDKSHRLPNNVNMSFLGVEGESVVLLLDKNGIAASTGSACSSASLEPSHVILAIHKSHPKKFEFAHGSIRFSLGRFNSAEEMKKIAEVMEKTIRELREISSVKAA